MSSITRVFSQTDQERFANWSADWNPLHMDPIWATTVYPGQVVVHGMHIVLWLLNELPTDQSITELSVTFVRPILLGDIVEAKVIPTPTGLTVIAQVRNKVMTRVAVEFGSIALPLAQQVTPTAKLPTVPQSLLLEELQGREGVIGLPEAAPLNKAFPSAHMIIGETSLRGLAGLSALVGMECPGLHAIFSEFSIKMQAKEHSGELRYCVTQIDPRFSRVNMTVNCGAFAGTIIAMVAKPDTSSELTISDGLVKTNEFASQTPLIIGGGSGLGAVSAKLLALGGAIPTITFNQDSNAGQRIKQEISAIGGHCRLLQLDVTNPNKGLATLRDLGWNGGQIYYFASPRIFRRRLEAYQDNDFKDFMRVYVSGFYEIICATLKLCNGAPSKVFYPSSIAAESFPPDMLEYALAKHAGEMLCDALKREFTSLQVIIERLPRIDSRQTRSFMKVAAARPTEIMLPILRKMNS